MRAAALASGRTIGRYVVFDKIASGGMATVHLGRMDGAASFQRTVAIKRLHPHLARDEDFVHMFLDEARIAARIRHPNVVGVLDVVHEGSELFLVMDYVQGETLSRLRRAVKPGRVPKQIAVTAMTGVLHGLHAAHDATDEDGRPLHIVHRDVSPQNVMIGVDGVARVLDFGVAKAASRLQTTQDGSLKGKIAYMAPEQLLENTVDRRSDVWAAAIVLWETLTGERLFDAETQAGSVRKILDMEIPAPSSKIPGLPKALDEAVMRGLERNPQKRWQTAREMAVALERAMPAATATEIGEWVDAIGGSALGERARRVREIESRSDIVATDPSPSGPRTREPMSTQVDDEPPPMTDRKPVQTKTVPLAFQPQGTPPKGTLPAQLRTVAMETRPMSVGPTARTSDPGTPAAPAPEDSDVELDEEVLPRSRGRSFVIGLIVVVLIAIVLFTVRRALLQAP